MIFLPRAVRVYFAPGPVNLRKSFDGLSNEVRAVLVHDPLTGHVFVFLNKRRNQVKLLVWTRGATRSCTSVSNAGRSEPVAPYVDPVLTPGSVCLALRQERVGLLREILGAIEDATTGGRQYLMRKLLVLLRQEGLRTDRSFTAQQRDVVNRALTDLEHEAARLAPDAALFERPARILLDVLALG